jgi:hypothetical protein
MACPSWVGDVTAIRPSELHVMQQCKAGSMRGTAQGAHDPHVLHQGLYNSIMIKA